MPRTTPIDPAIDREVRRRAEAIAEIAFVQDDRGDITIGMSALCHLIASSIRTFERKDVNGALEKTIQIIRGNVMKQKP